MADNSDFLSLQQRIDYLYDNFYFPHGSFTATDKDRLESMNFHYFLGYARNFRLLHDHGRLSGSKIPSEVFSLIDKDAEVSAFLYSGIRNAEWLLRHHTVQNFCQKFEARDHYLRIENYYDTGSDYTNNLLVQGLINDVLEYGEHFVVNNLKEKALEVGISVPKRCSSHNLGECQKLLEDLALWAVVDSFSLGRLVKFIERCDNSEPIKEHMWRQVSLDMDIPVGRFQGGLGSMRSLRNLVSHHSRLWMRPTTETATKKGQFRAKINYCHPKAMRIAFYNIASLQGSAQNRLVFAQKLEELIEADPNYLVGVSEFPKAKKI